MDVLSESGDMVIRQQDLQAEGRFADFLHQSLNHNITLADRKSSIVFTLVTAVVIVPARWLGSFERFGGVS